MDAMKSLGYAVIGALLLGGASSRPATGGAEPNQMGKVFMLVTTGADRV